MSSLTSEQEVALAGIQRKVLAMLAERQTSIHDGPFRARAATGRTSPRSSIS